MDGLDPFPLLTDHTCLVNTGSKILKLKLAYTGVDNASNALTQDKAHDELEDVFRALLYSLDRDRELSPMQTDHFIVRPSLVPWALSQKVAFKMDGRNLPCQPNVLLMNMTVKNTLQNQNSAPSCEASSSGTKNRDGIDETASKSATCGPAGSRQRLGNHNDGKDGASENDPPLALSSKANKTRSKKANGNVVSPTRNNGDVSSTLNPSKAVLATPRLSTANSIGSHSLRRISPLKRILRETASSSTTAPRTAKVLKRRNNSQENSLVTSSQTESSSSEISSQSLPRSTRSSVKNLSRNRRKDTSIKRPVHAAKQSSTQTQSSQRQTVANGAEEKKVPSTSQKGSKNTGRGKSVDDAVSKERASSRSQSPRKTRSVITTPPQRNSQRILVRKKQKSRSRGNSGSQISTRSNSIASSQTSTRSNSIASSQTKVKSPKKNVSPKMQKNKIARKTVSPRLASQKSRLQQHQSHHYNTNQRHRSKSVGKRTHSVTSVRHTLLTRKPPKRKGTTESKEKLSKTPRQSQERKQRYNARNRNRRQVQRNKNASNSNSRRSEYSDDNSVTSLETSTDLSQAEASPHQRNESHKTSLANTKLGTAKDKRRPVPNPRKTVSSHSNHLGKGKSTDTELVSDSCSSDDELLSPDLPSIGSFKRSPADQEEVLKNAIGGVTVHGYSDSEYDEQGSILDKKSPNLNLRSGNVENVPLQHSKRNHRRSKPSSPKASPVSESSHSVGRAGNRGRKTSKGRNRLPASKRPTSTSVSLKSPFPSRRTLRSSQTRSSQESDLPSSSQERVEASPATTEEVKEVRKRLLASRDGLWLF